MTMISKRERMSELGGVGWVGITRFPAHSQTQRRTALVRLPDNYFIWRMMGVFHFV